MQPLTHAKPTPVDLEAEFHRHAYNSAFNDLGLPWYWDEVTHAGLQASADERERIRVYLQTQQSHLLTAYEADFLIDAIRTTKQRHMEGRRA